MDALQPSSLGSGWDSLSLQSRCPGRWRASGRRVQRCNPTRRWWRRRWEMPALASARRSCRWDAAGWGWGCRWCRGCEPSAPAYKDCRTWSGPARTWWTPAEEEEEGRWVVDWFCNRFINILTKWQLNQWFYKLSSFLVSLVLWSENRMLLRWEQNILYLKVLSWPLQNNFHSIFNKVIDRLVCYKKYHCLQP